MVTFPAAQGLELPQDFEPVPNQPPDTPFPRPRPLEIDTPVPDVQPLEIDDGQNTDTTLPSQVVDSRAHKAFWALAGKTSKTAEDFKTSIHNGEESKLREDISTELDTNKMQTAQQILSQGGPDTIDKFLKFNQPTQPSTVFETHFADEYMRHLDWPLAKEDTGSWLRDAQISIPNTLQKNRDIGTDLIAKHQALVTKLENLKPALEGQGWPSYIADIALEMLPIPSRQRGNVPGVGYIEGGLLGKNLREQSLELWGKSLPEFNDIADKVIERYKYSPTVAAAWLQHMISQSTTDEVLNNTLTLLDLTTAGLIGESLAKAKLFNQSRQATRDTITSARTYSVGDPEMTIVPPEVTAPQGAGNLKEAGIQKVKIDKINEFTGASDPITEAQDGLSTNFNTMIDETSRNTGISGREVANRINELTEAGKNSFIDAVTNLMRVNRTPAVNAVEDVTRAVQDGIKNIYKHVDNEILDISEPMLEPLGNRYLFQVAMGRADGQLYESKDVAIVAARKRGFRVKEGMSPEETAFYTNSIKEAEAKLKEYNTEKSIFLTEHGIVPTDLQFRITNIQQGILNFRNQLDKLGGKSGVTIEYQGKSVPLYQLKQDDTNITGLSATGKNHFQAYDKDGNLVLNIAITPKEKGKLLYIEDVARLHHAPGSRGIRNVLAQLKEYYPDAERIGGVRLSGSRTGSAAPPSEVIGSYAESRMPVAIKQQGTGYYINAIVPLDETQPFVRNGIITTNFSNIPGQEGKNLLSIAEYKKALDTGAVSTGIAPSRFGGWLNVGVGNMVKSLRTPEETLSITENAQRKKATHAPSALLSVVQENTRAIEILPKKYWGDFSRFIRAGQNKIDPETGVQGYWFKNLEDIEDWYQRYIGRLPVEKELQAYYSYRTNMAMDHGLRTISLIRNKSRVGVEQTKFSYLPKGSNSNRPIETAFFDAARMDHLPQGEDTILFMGEKEGEEKLYRGNRIPDKFRQSAIERIKAGQLRVVQVYDPDLDNLPFNFGKAAGKRIRYVVSHNLESKPLEWNQIPNRGGGHLMPDYEFYIKQADMREDILTNSKGDVSTHWNYRGDNTLTPIRTRAEGNEIVPHINQVIQHLQNHYRGRNPTAEDLARWENEGGAPGRASSLDIARDYSNKHLGIDWDIVHGWFVPERDPVTGGVKPPRLNMHEPVRVVPKDVQISQMDDNLAKRYGDAFKDRTRTGSLARANVVEFTGERDVHNLMTFKKSGTQDNPIWTYEPAEYVDPITAMDRGLVRIVNSTIMDDMKFYSMEHFLQQAKPWLDLKEGELESKPWAIFSNITEKSFKAGTPRVVKYTLLSNWKQARDFAGMPSKLDTILHSMAQDISDQIYGVAGPKFALVPLHALPYVRSPIAYLRSVVFNLDQGFYSPRAMFMQASTYANIFFISPRHAPAATHGATLWGYSRLTKNPEILNYLDTLATKMRFPGLVSFRPGEWLELTQGLENSSFFRVGDEHAYRATALPNQLLRNWISKGIKGGQTPFNIGAATTRIGAWYTAGLEYLQQHPGPISRQGWDTIFNRAALLDSNMSRASSSPLHTGAMSIPFQYQAFTLRQSELMFGKRLDQASKARLMIGNFLAYGAKYGAIGLGVPLVGPELSDTLYKEAIENWGYITGKNIGADAFWHGLLSVAVATVTGFGDPHKGTYYDFQKFGVNGLDPIENLIEGTEAWWKIIAGPLGSHIEGFLKEAKPMVRVSAALLKGDSSKYPITSDNIISLFKEISTVRDIWRLAAALKYGDWLTKNEDKITEISKTNAWLMAILGVHPLEGVDVYEKQKLIENIKDLEKHLKQEFILAHHRFMRDDVNNDKPSAERNFSQAMTIMSQIPQWERAAVLSESYRRMGQSLVKRVDWQLYEVTKDIDRLRDTNQVKENRK